MKPILQNLSRNIIEVLIVALLVALLILFLCFLIGYFANALWGYKFDLASCWAGVAALAVACGAGGVGKYWSMGMVHVDCGPRRDWTEND